MVLDKPTSGIPSKFIGTSKNCYLFHYLVVLIAVINVVSVLSVAMIVTIVVVVTIFVYMRKKRNQQCEGGGKRQG